MTVTRRGPVGMIFGLVFISAAMFATASQAGDEAGIASEWVAGAKSRTRLIAGEAGGRLMGFVEIELASGWKTYWRNPGEAGGLPPSFDWSQSRNIAQVEVLYPAPHRMTDKLGDTIGYKEGVIFPVVFARPAGEEQATLDLRLEYGICKDVCVPVEANLKIDLPTGAPGPAPEAALEAVRRVPRAQDRLEPGDPAIIGFEAVLSGAKPTITVQARLADGTSDADVYLDAEGGIYVPHPKKIGARAGGEVVFEAVLGDDVDLAALQGRKITATLVGAAGASTATIEGK